MSWQQQLQQSFSNIDDLLHYLELPKQDLPVSLQAIDQFALRIPKPYADKIQKGNLDDPLLKQALPISAELQSIPGFVKDPLQETKVNPIPGLLHKYHGRVLLTVTSACGIHCRYCFRRHFPYEDNMPGKQGWVKAIEYIANDNSINEVILSGGDPLVANDKALSSLLVELSTIKHLKKLRIHSRMPVVIPDRVTQKLIDLLSDDRWQSVLVLHCNHANELDDTIADKMAQLRQSGVTILNQSVLLKGVNDTIDDLLALSEKLFAMGVLPYYLHLLDKVQGSAHFDVSLKKARSLMQGLLHQLPGYLVPRLVFEKAGEQSKVPVDLQLGGNNE